MSVPKLRFPGFAAGWEKKRLSAAWRVKGKRNYDGTYSKDQVLSVSGEKGIVNQIEHLGRSYAGALVDNYHVVEKGDIVYTKSPLKANPFGIIKANKGAAGIVSTLYAVYEVKEQNDPEFWDRYFELDDRTNGYLMPLVHIGAKNDMKINNERVLIDPVYIPSLPEQQKIATFLGAMDAKLAALAAKQAALVRYKAGLMQKLFSQQLRFARDDGTAFQDWEETRFGEVFERIRRKNEENNTNVLTISAQQGLVSQQDYFNKSVSASDVTGYYLLHRGDFTYNKSYSKGYPMGAIKRLNKYAKGVVSTLYICFNTAEEVTARYFEQFFESGFLNREIEKIAQEGARNHGLLNVGVKDFFDQIYFLLPHPDEQKKIADTLSTMDAKIQAVADQVTKLQTFKKGLLQQMFV